jgi:hypothetical protein
MTTNRCVIGALAVSALVLGAAGAQDQLLAFRDPNQGQWGYKRPDGRVAIPPRFLGAGAFREGRAPVEDADGFAMIDDTGRIVERIVTDSVSASAGLIPPPADTCAGPVSAPVPNTGLPFPPPGLAFPSTGLQCYVRQLRGSAPVIGGEITIRPPGGESARSAVVLRFPTGVVVVEDIGYEGFTRRVLLPGVSGEQALEWRLRLYPDVLVKDGCSESWQTGIVPGGAFIEQAAGC